MQDLALSGPPAQCIGKSAEAHRGHDRMREEEIAGPQVPVERIHLAERRIDPLQSSGLFMPDHPVVIEPTATTSWQHALSAFNAAARAHYTNITLGKAG